MSDTPKETRETGTKLANSASASEFQIEVVDSWDRCHRQICEVLDMAGETNPFLSIEWLETWWKHWGTGKRLQVHLFLKGGAPVGFAPLYCTEVLGIREYFFVGHRKSNYLGVVCPSGEVEGITKMLLNSVEASGRPALMHFMDLNSTSPTFSAMRALKEADAPNVTLFPLYPCPYARLSGDWEDFFKQIMGRKHRTQIKAAERRLASLGDLSFSMSGDPREIESMLPALQALHRARFERNYNPSLEGRHGAFMKDVVPLMAGDKLLLASLTLDGEPVAFLLGLGMSDTFVDYIPAFDPALERFSPGHVLIMKVAQWLISHGYRVLDFSKGDEVYKRKWSNGESQNYLALAVLNPNPALKAYAAFRRLSVRIRIWLREEGHNRTVKRLMARLRRRPSRRGGRRSVEVRSFDSPPGLAGEPFKYGRISKLPLEARKALADFSYVHHDGQPMLAEPADGCVSLYDERSGERIEVSW